MTRKPVKAVRGTEERAQASVTVPKTTKEKRLSLTSLELDHRNDRKGGSSSSLSSTSSNGRSWADKVKGISRIPPISESDVMKSESTSAAGKAFLGKSNLGFKNINAISLGYIY